MGKIKLCGRAAIGVALCVSAPAIAGYVDIGGGWAAEWDESLDPYVNIEGLGVQGDAVHIRKIAEFTQASEGGVFPSIPIVFRQTELGAAEFIVIDDELITNSTGEDWYDFHMQLINGDDAFFDVERTMNSGGGGPIGWSIDPFLQAGYSDDLKGLDVWDGMIADGGQWRPGAGGGELWIDVAPAGPDENFTIFTLKETPTPAHGTLALLAVAGSLCVRRRRA